MQATDGEPVVDRVRADAQREQLLVRDDAVLAIRKRSNLPINMLWDLLTVHTPVKRSQNEKFAPLPRFGTS